MNNTVVHHDNFNDCKDKKLDENHYDDNKFTNKFGIEFGEDKDEEEENESIVDGLKIVDQKQKYQKSSKYFTLGSICSKKMSKDTEHWCSKNVQSHLSSFDNLNQSFPSNKPRVGFLSDHADYTDKSWRWIMVICVSLSDIIISAIFPANGLLVVEILRNFYSDQGIISAGKLSLCLLLPLCFEKCN